MAEESAPELTAQSPQLPAGGHRRTLRPLIGGMLVVLVVLGAAWAIHLRDIAINDAARRASAAARLLEEHMSWAVRTTDFVLSHMVLHMRGKNPSDLRPEIAALVPGLPERGSLLVVGPDGKLVIGSIDGPAAEAFTAADRDWFKAHLAGAERVVGPLIASRIDGRLVFTVSRRIDTPDGRFGGAVMAAINADYFDSFYRNLELGPAGNTGVADSDGRLILRQPGAARFAGRTITGGPLALAAAGNPTGTVRARSMLDGVERIVAFRVLPELGIIVSCGIALDDALAGWRRDAGLAAVAMAAMVAALAWLALRSLGHEEAVLRSLERAVADRTQEAVAQAEQARRANDSKTRFLAAASHDLRQPLQAAGMFVEVLSARIEDPALGQIVDKLRQSIEATNALLTTLLDASTLEAGKVQPRLQAFPVMTLLASLADQLEPEATARGLDLRVVPSSLRVVSDPVLLERMLRNLSVNALRCTDRGRVLLGCRRDCDKVTFVIADTGIGIPADKLETIFEDFARIDTPGAPRKGARGLGLGLGVVRRMATLLDHGIAVRSTLGKGSIFTVTCPMAPAVQPVAVVQIASS
jgi:signal transduction histidine kinase